MLLFCSIYLIGEWSLDIYHFFKRLFFLGKKCIQKFSHNFLKQMQNAKCCRQLLLIFSWLKKEIMDTKYLCNKSLVYLFALSISYCDFWNFHDNLCIFRFVTLASSEFFSCHVQCWWLGHFLECKHYF